MSFLSAILNGIIGVFAAIFRGKTGIIVNNLFSLVMAIVKDLSKENLPGDMKRKAAYQRIVAAATAAGLSYADHAVNLLIELCVTQLKGKSVDKILEKGLRFAEEAVRETAADFAAHAFDANAIPDSGLLFQQTKVNLIGKLKMAGLEMKESAINLLIESAVAMEKE